MADNGSYTSDFWYPENGNKTEYVLFQNANSDFAPEVGLAASSFESYVFA